MLLSHEKPETEGQPEEGSDEPKGFWGRLDQRRAARLRPHARRLRKSVLDAALARRTLVVVAAALFVGASGLLYGVVGLDFFPSVDAGLMRFHFQAPSGSRIDRPEQLVDAVEQRDAPRLFRPRSSTLIDDNIGVPLLRQPRLRPERHHAEHDAEVMVGLKPKHHAIRDYQNAIRRAVRDEFPGSALYFEQADIVSQVLNFGLPAEVAVEVQSRDYRQSRLAGSTSSATSCAHPRGSGRTSR